MKVFPLIMLAPQQFQVLCMVKISLMFWLVQRMKNNIELENNSKILYLYRHGELNWNVEDRITGQLGEEEKKFTNFGYRQIDEIARNLKSNDIQVIYCSDYKRASKTAKIANSRLGILILYWKELQGLNIRKYQGNIMQENTLLI